MMEIIESGDEYIEPRFSNGSMSCLFPALVRIESPRRSISYNKLPEEPLKLTIRKLDGTSFGIKVPKTGTIRELKRAVEDAFSYLPKKGPRRVSWEHVWGQFCLCHEGHKLLHDSDYIRMFRIRDGDQLHFVHHASNTYNSVSPRNDDSDSDDDEPTMDDNRERDVESGGDHRIEILVDTQENIDEWEDDDVISRCEYRLSRILRKWFLYSKLPGSDDVRFEGRGQRSNSSGDIVGFFKNIFGASGSSKYDSRRRAWKVK